MTVAAFQQELANRFAVPPPNQELLSGFPPTVLQVQNIVSKYRKTKVLGKVLATLSTHMPCCRCPKTLQA